jgi:FKBP-type peptidyl-prolyl cis-trans isomerase FkpA
MIMAGIFTSCLEPADDIEYTAEREQELISQYLARLQQGGYAVKNSPLGVYYVVIDEGDGDYPAAGDTLSVQYAGYRVTGELFDASVNHSTDSAFHFVYKETEMIPGWEEMMGIMNKGRKLEFLVPSNLAYGSTGASSIPPYTSLVFVAKMINIRPKSSE